MATHKESQFYSETMWRLMSGGISGAVSRTCVAPIERTIILKQTNNPKYYKLNLINALVTMYKTEGILSMFKGNGANCLRIAPFQAIEFSLFDKLKNKYKFRNQNMAMLMYGAISGSIATMLVYPFDLVKTILAVQPGNEYKGIFNTMIVLGRNRGPFALFKGLSATLVGISPYAAFKLTFFQILKNNLQPLMKFLNKDVQNLVFGGLAGCMALSITYPTDVIRRRLQFQILQNNEYVGYLPTIKSMHASQGVSVFYRGLFATYAKIIPSTAIAFTINEKLKAIKNLQ